MQILFKNQIQNTYQELDALYSSEQWKNKKIILFGMNTPAEIEFNFFKMNNIPVYAIIDNDCMKHGTLYHNCKILPPEDVLSDYDENVFVIIASNAYEAMSMQVMKMGYPDRQIYRLKSFELENLERFSMDKHYEYKELSLREIQIESLKMLKYIRDFCKKKNIRYFLSDGTLLGAVRHKGFIPWDDDIDISMPWNDYVRFCNEFENTKIYEITSMFNENAFQLPCNSQIARVMNTSTITELYNFPIYTRQGICVDIFPLNGYPESKNERIEYETELKHLANIWQRNVRNKIASPEYSKDLHMETWNMIRKAMTRYEYDTSKYVGGVFCMQFNHSIAPRNCYENHSTAEFEGEIFNVPNDPDYILTQAYGNYMQYPPLEKRNPKHFFRTYQITKSKNIQDT